ncbi:phosphoribosylformylglycinamidine synthase subunit PurS [Armatimonas sp.]|uniref:phosphoribosylformylglycinamidine synthase subunit PurS n=1 Tax=Armatimonas sp. TaxID=1872638 RepID=UPI00286B4CEC|nr:phosphoribosylformylglycinamidine synthase subunit PurS [Armatimonas sp.]
MSKVTVTVTLKPALLDAQGRTIQEALHSLGYTDVKNVRVGKVIELETANPEDAKAMCEKLLANPVMESYHIEVDANGVAE